MSSFCITLKYFQYRKAKKLTINDINIYHIYYIPLPETHKSCCIGIYRCYWLGKIRIFGCKTHTKVPFKVYPIHLNLVFLFQNVVFFVDFLTKHYKNHNVWDLWWWWAASTVLWQLLKNFVGEYLMWPHTTQNTLIKMVPLKATVKVSKTFLLFLLSMIVFIITVWTLSNTPQE